MQGELPLSENVDPRSSSDRELYLPDREFYLPIYQFVRLTKREVAVVNHPAVQRLGDVYQLGQTHLVYRGATHRRLEHSLGTLRVAQRIVDSLTRNSTAVRKAEDKGRRWLLDDPLRPEEVTFIRLAALLHDVGHIAAGHTFEDELALFGKHDSDARLGFILDKTTWHGEEYPPLRALIDDHYQADAETAALDMSASDALLTVISKDRADKSPPAESAFRLQVCRDIVGNTICADLLDYLHRDWHHLGKHRHFDERLIDYMELRRDGDTSALVVYLRHSDKVRTDAVSAILDLLESRYQLFEIALYHRTKLIAGAMLERVVLELADAQGDDEDRGAWLERLEEDLVELSDNEMLVRLAADADAAASEASPDRRPYLGAAATVARRLRTRSLHRIVYQAFNYQLGHRADAVQRLYAPGSGERSSEEAALNRFAAVRQLERDFELPPFSVVMYCPPKTTSTKIAEVQIVLDDGKWTLDEYESRQGAGDAGLTGGHLQAQQKRYERLWRVMFACDRSALADLERRGLKRSLTRAIKCYVLGVADEGRNLDETAADIASELARTTGSPYDGLEVVEPEPAFARSSTTVYYPTDLPPLAAHYRHSGA